MGAELASEVLAACSSAGISEFCVCAGARSVGLVVGLERSEGCRVWHFFDERSAAFFALGRMMRGGAPVAVVTTSGTAVAELLPATIEAHYQALPLVLLTADRPPRFRGSGAPQAIEQVGLFSSYADCLDVDTTGLDVGDFLSRAIQRGRPAQVNVCFEEPTADQIESLEGIEFLAPAERPRPVVEGEA
ncbi:MAG: thiamine pyrophosphate-binding protein, partial [Verrucomicrobiales bacterium]